MVDDFQTDMAQAVEVRDAPIVDAPLLDTEEKMRRYLAALAARVKKIEDILSRNNLA